MASEYVENGVPFLRSQNVTPFRLRLDDVKFVRPEFHTRLKKSALRPGDVVVIRTGYPGVAAVIPATLPEANCADLVVVTPSTTELDPYYLAAVFNSTWGKATVAGNLVGVAQQHFNIGAARSLEIELPPLQVQRTIAAALSAYDELVENYEQRIRLLDRMARALYREWFVLYRYPGHEKATRTDSPVGSVPRGWKVECLGAGVRIHRGRSYRSSDLAEDGGVPFVNLKCIDRGGGFRRSGLKRFVGPTPESHAVRRGDIVVAVTDMTQERRIVARAALVPTLGAEFGVLSMDLVRLEPLGSAPPAWLYAYLRYSEFADHLKQHANGANVLHLSPDRIRERLIVVPPASLTRAFADHVGPLFELHDVLATSIDALKTARDLLLPRLLSGQLTLPVAA
jgi:type I restriction enzyme S subunit